MAQSREGLLQLRADKQQYYAQAFADGFQRDSITALTAAVMEDNDSLMQMDGVIVRADEKLSLSAIIVDSIMGAVASQENITVDTIETAMAVAKQVADVNIDSINNMQGGEILGTLVALNIHTVLSASIQGIDGNISDLSPLSGGRDNTKFEVLSVTPLATIGMGDFVDGTAITAINASEPMAFTEREDKQVFVTDTLTYTFNAKAKEADGSNYGLEKGKNEVSVGTGVVELNDYDVSSREATASRTVTEDGITYTATFNYVAGTIVLVVSANIDNGTNIYFSGSLSSEKLGEISGTVGVEIENYKYTSKAVVLNVTANSLNSRRVLQGGKLNLLSTSMGVAINKIAEETKAKKIDKAVRYATPFGDAIDLTATGSDYSTIASQFKLFNMGVEGARADITIASQTTSKVAIIGGSALVKIVSALTDDTEGSAKVITDDNTSFRLLGMINGIYPAYFDPRHDAKYPLDGTSSDESTVFIIGTPSDPTKRAVISGVGLPILPESLSTDANSNKTISLQGELVVDTNKDPRARKLARIIKVKV